MDENLKEEIKRLIARNKTEQAIKLLSSVQFSKVDKDLIILNSRYNRVQEELMLNTISNEEAERKINKINLALLDLSNKMDGKGSSLASESTMGFNRQWLWLLALPIAALIGYLSWPTPATNTAENTTTDGATLTEDQGSKEAPATIAVETNPTVMQPPPEPEPAKMKVRFTLDKMRVIKDGDSFTDYGGDFYWTIKVNNATLASRVRNNPIELNDGDEHLFNESATFELSEDDLTTLVLVANIIDADGGTSGGDDRIEITYTYNWQDFVFPANKIISGKKQGDAGGDPSVELYWTLQLLSN